MKVLIKGIGIFLISLVTWESWAQEANQFIVVDQFGYLPEALKIAVIRNPKEGFDADASFEPGTEYSVVNAETEAVVFTGSLAQWSGGATSASSGDKCWWFDFSEVTEVGSYYVLDVEKDVRSYEFQISPAVYNEVLKQAMRTFFYQRAGYEKLAEYAGHQWADGASHIGTLQDTQARLFNDINNAILERDLSGGWYDAGDYNKYTSWTANYVVDMMKAYLERPEAWGDDYRIPESGNGIPDILDEAKWGMDHLIRLQEEDGSVLSIVDLAHASPPSSATGRSLYGPATTSATLNTAAAFAIGSVVYQQIGMEDYATDLEAKARSAWEWAQANPEVLFRNNDATYNSVGIGAGQQEEDDYHRDMSRLEAACFLFELTGESEFRDYFDTHYQDAHLVMGSYTTPFEAEIQESLLYYTTIANATTEVVSSIKQKYSTSLIGGNHNYPAYTNKRDPYRAHISDYTWGSNSVKSNQGSMYYNMLQYELSGIDVDDATNAAAGYIHYLHGVNPLGMVYLSNMYRYGASNSANEFYHTWFQDGSNLWDRVGESVYGPAPGFVVGGPNPSYNWDSCCPDGCGSAENNAVCTEDSIVPPKSQPDQKSYKDFNTSWPLNSWEVTENSNGYQVHYIRLLSKFVDLSYDCTGQQDGDATVDVCGRCAGGTTGLEPINDTESCPAVDPVLGLVNPEKGFDIYPNPGADWVRVSLPKDLPYDLKFIDIQGREVLRLYDQTPSSVVDLMNLEKGNYILVVHQEGKQFAKPFIKN